MMTAALDADIRDLCVNGAEILIHGICSVQEAGIITLQCPEGDGYHVMAESVLVEMLDDAGTPCAAGEIGCDVVKPFAKLHDTHGSKQIGDYAEVGASCGCDRGLPSERQFLGYVRNMLLLPSGEKNWPFFGSRGLMAAAPVRQHQIVQKSATALEARLVVARELTEDEEKVLARHITARLPEPMTVTFFYPNTILRSASGKFEDFLSEIDGV